MPKKILDMQNIAKSFAGVTVLDDVRFDLYEGEVHALMGENGAGKSTLMKILTGVYTKDSGTVEKLDANGNMVRLENITPKSAQEQGISIVFQEFNLLNNMSIAENVFIGREPKTKAGTVDWKQLFKDTKRILERVRLDKNPQTLVADLSVAEKQSVEIAKCLSYEADIIVLDEPTSSLTDREVEVLFDLIAELKAQGTSIIYISHRMDEIFKITDRITKNFLHGSMSGSASGKRKAIIPAGIAATKIQAGFQTVSLQGRYRFCLYFILLAQFPKPPKVFFPAGLFLKEDILDVFHDLPPADFL